MRTSDGVGELIPIEASDLNDMSMPIKSKLKMSWAWDCERPVAGFRMPAPAQIKLSNFLAVCHTGVRMSNPTKMRKWRIVSAMAKYWRSSNIWKGTVWRLFKIRECLVEASFFGQRKVPADKICEEDGGIRVDYPRLLS